MENFQKEICIQIDFNNPLKVCFSNKKYLMTIQTRPTQIIFFIENPVFTDFKDYWCTKSIT